MIQKQTIMKPYLRATVNEIEDWLTKMAEEGWHLTDLHGWKFTFERKKPASIKYFICSSTRILTFNGISYDYHTAKMLYQSKSDINKRNLPVFEADTNKIDEHFEEYKRLRNKWYQKEFLAAALLTFLFLCITGFIVCNVTEKPLFCFTLIVLVFWTVMFFYHLISFFWMRTHLKT